MGKRKGELTSAQIDREYPHQIILPARCYSGANYRSVQAFCIGLSLAPRGHAVFMNNEWHHVFCFAERADAEKLKDKLGGDFFNTETRGRGARWHLLRDGRKGVAK